MDATSSLLSYSPFIGAAEPLRSVTGTGNVPRGLRAEVIDGQYYPDRPLPLSYRPLEDPYASSVSLVPNFQIEYGAFGNSHSVVANLYANQNKYFSTVLAGLQAGSGMDIRT